MTTIGILMASACFSDGGGVESTAQTDTSTADSTNATTDATSADDAGTSSTSATTSASMGTTASSDTGMSSDDATTSSDTTGSETGSSTCDGMCVSAVPDDWQGPVAVWEGGDVVDAPDCAGSYPDEGGTFFADLDPGTSQCECTCEDATGIVCSSPVELCFNDGGLQCLQACENPQTAEIATCTVVDPGASTHARASNPAPTNAGTCAAVPNHTLGTPVWGAAVRTCGGASPQPDGCEGAQVCAPVVTRPFESLCIAHTGDLECPDGSFSQKRLVHGDFDDTRACSACSCGAADSSCDGTVFFLNSAGGICNVFVGSVAAGGCGTHDSATRVEYDPDPTGTCPPQGGQLSGEVTPTDPVTLCCQP